MKKVIFISTIATMMLLSVNANAQSNGKILAGGGLSYATDISTLGIFAKGVYQVTDQWEGSFGFTYFLPKDYGYGAKLTWMAFDLNAHYVFHRQNQMEFYALAGLNILRISTPSISMGGYTVPSASASESGVNLGAGGRYQISGNLYGMAELKYTLGNANFLQAGAGVLFRF